MFDLIALVTAQGFPGTERLKDSSDNRMVTQMQY